MTRVFLPGLGLCPWGALVSSGAQQEWALFLCPVQLGWLRWNTQPFIGVVF